MECKERDHQPEEKDHQPEETDQPEEKDQELVEQAYAYLTTSTYPPGCTENRKRVIRTKAKKFELRDGELFYKQKQKGKVLSTVWN